MVCFRAGAMVKLAIPQKFTTEDAEETKGPAGSAGCERTKSSFREGRDWNMHSVSHCDDESKVVILPYLRVLRVQFLSDLCSSST